MNPKFNIGDKVYRNTDLIAFACSGKTLTVVPSFEIKAQIISAERNAYTVAAKSSIADLPEDCFVPAHEATKFCLQYLSGQIQIVASTNLERLA